MQGRYNAGMREGSPAPDFETTDQDGTALRLSDFRGRVVVLFFYPRACTSGCTIEAQGFRDAYRQFERAGVVVLGISPDTAKAQKKFELKEALPYRLLADDSRAIAELYGVLKEKNMYGRKVMGVARTTLLIDAAGVVRHVFNRVKPEGHAEEVLGELRALRLSAGN